MSVFLKRGVCFCYLLLTVACNPEKPVEDLVSEYWTALARGDTAAAYRFLSSADRNYIDAKTFKAYLLEQPALDFLLLPPEHLATGHVATKKRRSKEKKAAEAAALVRAEVTHVSISGNHARALVKVRVPALETWLGDPLMATLRGAESNLTTESLLLRRLAGLPATPPWSHHTHTLTLIRERQGWRVTYPRWRAQAMLFQAKRLSADKDLEGALAILEDLSGFADTLDQVSQLDLVQSARRGRRMLPYLRTARLSGFRRTGASLGCPETATLRLSNDSDLALKTASGVIAFLDEYGRVLAKQTLELVHPHPVAPQESATFDVCLEPPNGWEGEAQAWVSWLVFTDESYQRLMR